LVTVTDAKKGSKFERVYEFENKNRYFIGASKKQDDKNINDAVGEVIENIVNDEALIGSLTS
jgi:uncharacterized lipoprotein YajG